MFLEVAACIDTETILGNKEGQFGIVGPQYRDNLYCRWQIIVETEKVTVTFLIAQTGLGMIKAYTQEIRPELSGSYF